MLFLQGMYFRFAHPRTPVLGCVVLDDPVRTVEVLGLIIAQLNARSHFLAPTGRFRPFSLNVMDEDCYSHDRHG